jgi:hypothetical protein
MKQDNQTIPIQAIDSQGNVERWELFKAESGAWALRDETGETIEFETTIHKSRRAMTCCLSNRGLTADIKTI